ncbi:MAG: MG2 domain-containing protein [Prosthecobacter sp.]|nr:MG2 domain-containing protein [Prosthecobacter sp.]
MPAGTEAKLSLVFRNAKKISLTARKVDVAKLLADTEAYLRSEPQQQQDWQQTQVDSIGQRLLNQKNGKYLGEITAKWEQELQPRANHWDRRVDVVTPLKAAGAWWVEGTFEGGHVARTLVWIEDLVIVQTKQATGGHYFVADAVTGAPIPGAKIKFFGWRQDWKDPGVVRKKPVMVYAFKDHQSLADEKGQVRISQAVAKDYQWLITATTTDGREAHLGFEQFWFGDNREVFGEQTRLYTITDRPVYRPGQEVKWKAWARTVGYGLKVDSNRFKGASIEVVIQNPRGEKILEKIYKADDSGAISDTLLLGDDAALGQYQVSMTRKRTLRGDESLGSHQFRVEEYKKPEFEVKVEAPKTPVALGDAFEIKVKADYYFGGPVKEGKVKYKVQRSAHADQWFPPGPWDWLFGEGYGWRGGFYEWYPGAENWCRYAPIWPWWPRRSDPPELVANGEAALNADGTFTIKIDTALAKELHGNEDHRYEIEAEVTDQSRRMIHGTGAVLAARRPFEVYVWLDRGYYQAGEAGEVRVTARTLDGRTVAAKGKLKLLRVTYDKEGKPSEEEVSAFNIKTGDEETRQKVKWIRGGQYRVACLLKDEAGHEIEGVAFTTVRGEGFNEGKDFHFDDLELITQKDEYSPGEEVEITLNTNRPGSTVALFLRAQNGVYPEPIWIKLEGKSTTHRFTLKADDQPNIFLDAYTVSNAHVHQVTQQIIVPPKKRIATVELEPDKETYLPREGSRVKVLVKDQDGKPFVGQVVLTAYDKALEYISGGSNIEDIRPFFWGWKRSHQPEIQDSLLETETSLWKEGEVWIQPLGMFGATADEEFKDGRRTAGRRGLLKSGSGRMMAYGGAMAGASADSFAMAAAPAAAPPPVSASRAGKLELEVLRADAAGDQSNGVPGPQPMIRSNLADSAVWVADLTTDANGEGVLNFDMPDNLTTWKLRSWVMGPQTQVGEAAVEVITRKNLMVRLQAPRFFVEKDEVVISANVHNEMEVPQDVKAVLELEGGVLEMLPFDVASAKVPAHSEKRFDWRVKVIAEGEAKVRVKALAQKDSDAMEMTFPAYTHGMLKTDSWSLALRPDQTSGSLTMRVPKERKPEQTRLEVRYSPTLAMALVDALPYLTDYPYGCTEQTLNRFVPTVITLGVLKNLGVNLADVRKKRANLNAQEIGDPKKRASRWQGKDGKGKPKQPVFDEDEVKKMAKAGLNKLSAMRNGDGGWGWFPGGRESSPHITAIVLHGLRAAEHAGLDVNDGVIRNGIEWLKAHEAEELRRLRLPEKDKDHKSSPDNLDALIHSVLVEYKTGDAGMREMLYEKRKNLSRYNLALLGLACHQLGEKERRDMCLRNLRQFLKLDDENQTAWLELPDGGWWWFWHEDQIETQAAFLRLLVAAEPKSDVAPRLAKYLLNNRRNGTYWNSTKDTAAVIEAMAEFVKVSGESKPNLKLEVAIDGKVQKTVDITPENLFTFDGTLVLEGDALATGEHKLEMRKTGLSPLYSNAYLTVFSQEDMIPPAGLEVKVRRKFYKLIEEKPNQQVAGSRGQVVTQTGFKYRREEVASDVVVRSGDLIEVELSVESKNDYEYVIIEDMKPAGFEPIEVQSGWSWEGLQSYKEFRDEKVAFFAERLPRGTHNLSYRVKAEIPGRFSALPTKIEAMYAPELKGNSTEWKARIEE